MRKRFLLEAKSRESTQSLPLSSSYGRGKLAVGIGRVNLGGGLRIDPRVTVPYL